MASNDDGLALDTELELEDGTVVTLGDLLKQAQGSKQMREQLRELKSFQENATKLMRGEVKDGQTAYEVLKGAGYSDDEAQKYAEEYVSNSEGSDQEADVQENSKGSRADQRAEQAMSETRDLRLRMLKEQMDKNIVSAIDGNPQIVKMLETLDKTRGREHAAGAWRALQDQVREQTLKQLYTRRDAEGGKFNEDWVAGEAAKAAESIAGNYRTVIGDIDGLGRSPETDSEMEILKSKPEVPAPEFKKGMDRGDADRDVREFNVDALNRMAAEISAGGETKV